MDVAIQKKNQSFRLSVDLIERLKELAKCQNRSLNNFVETLLIDASNRFRTSSKISTS